MFILVGMALIKILIIMEYYSLKDIAGIAGFIVPISKNTTNIQ